MLSIKRRVDAAASELRYVTRGNRPVAEVAELTPATASDPAEDILHPRLLPHAPPRRSVRGARRTNTLGDKDMAGLLARKAGGDPSRVAMGSAFRLPVHVHTHDTPGGQLATYVRGVAGPAQCRRRWRPHHVAGTHQATALRSIRGRRRAHALRTPDCPCRGMQS